MFFLQRSVTCLVSLFREIFVAHGMADYQGQEYPYVTYRLRQNISNTFNLQNRDLILIQFLVHLLDDGGVGAQHARNEQDVGLAAAEHQVFAAGKRESTAYTENVSVLRVSKILLLGSAIIYY